MTCSLNFVSNQHTRIRRNVQDCVASNIRLEFVKKLPWQGFAKLNKEQFFPQQPWVWPTLIWNLKNSATLWFNFTWCKNMNCQFFFKNKTLKNSTKTNNVICKTNCCDQLTQVNGKHLLKNSKRETKKLKLLFSIDVWLIFFRSKHARLMKFLESCNGVVKKKPCSTRRNGTNYIPPCFNLT